MSGNEISLDAFQTLIESKLKTPFTSLELSKCLQTTSLSPKTFITYLQGCFKKMTKPIQLRCIIGLLSFEPDLIQQYGNQESIEDFEDALEQFLDEDYDEKWVKVLSGIIRGKICHDHISDEPRRNETSDLEIHDAVDEIIQDILVASNDALELSREVKAVLKMKLKNQLNENESQKIFPSFQIGVDMKPYFIPSSYTLCDSKIILAAFPELNQKYEFIVNEDANILHEDDIDDRSKAEEERKELEQEERLKAMAEERRKKIAMESAQKNGMIVSVGNTNQIGNLGLDTASLMMQSVQQKTQSGAMHPSISPQMGNNTVTGAKVRTTGLGRGAAADAIGGWSLGNQMYQNLPMEKIKSTVLSNLGASKGRAVAMKHTKMKMIDVSEVEELKKEGEARMHEIAMQESRESRKRKILESAAAKGLKAKKGWAAASKDHKSS